MESFKPEQTLPEYIDMYQVSGSGPITVHSWQRYLACAKELPQIKEAAEKVLDPELVEGFKKGEEKVSYLDFVEPMKLLSEEEKKDFVLDLVKNPDRQIQKIAVMTLTQIDVSYRLDVMVAMLEESAFLEKEQLLDYSGVLNEPEMCIFFEKVLQVDDPILLKKLDLYLRGYAIGDFMTEENILSFREKLKPSLEQHRENIKSSTDILRALDMIQLLDNEDRLNLIKKAFLSEDELIKKVGVEKIGFISQGKNREQLVAFAIANNAGKYLIEANLYDVFDGSETKFSKKDFEKNGSALTLLGGELKDKVVYRHITAHSFLAWKTAYESTELWKNAGFDYVPIEPILTYSLNKKSWVDVASGVLDVSLNTWMYNTSLFVGELQEKRTKIKDILRSQNIDHGHPHEGNFCLRFWRKENGELDFTRCPRIYLIDFDQAALLQQA